MRGFRGSTLRGTPEARGDQGPHGERAAGPGEPVAAVTKALPHQLLPSLSEQEYEALRDDIKLHGVQVPVVYDEAGRILDGHHRVRACQELGIRKWPQVVVPGLSDEQKEELVLRLNALRRHLTREQKQALALKLRQQGWTQERIAQTIGVDQSTVGRWLQDVMQMHHVDAESGKPALPATITDTLGRLQPARKPKRQPPLVEKEPGVGQLAAPSLPRPSPEHAAEAASPGPSAPQPAAPAEAAPASAGGSSPARPAPEATPGEGAAPTSKPGAAAPAPVESTDVWTYLRRCVPERLPEPGPLDGEAYARAVAFEAVLAVLGRVVRQVEEGRQVVRAWRTWRGHHGDVKALDEAVRLLEAAARHLRTLGPVPAGSSRSSPKRLPKG